MNGGRLRRLPRSGRALSRGATPRASPRRRPRRWPRRLLLGALGAAALGGLTLGAQKVLEPLADWLNRPVTEVAVEGEFRYLDREAAQTLMNRQLGEGFLQLDLSGIRRALERNPWVDRAALRRRWPDRLEVTLYEQEPIARWGETGFVNRRGEVIAIEQTEALAHLPLLEGAERDAERMLARYRDMVQLLQPRGLAIAALRSDRKDAWQLTLEDGVVLVLGRDRELEKLRRFAAVYDRTLRRRWPQVERVDLRYHNGAAVAWKDEPGDGDRPRTDETTTTGKRGSHNGPSS